MKLRCFLAVVFFLLCCSLPLAKAEQSPVDRAVKLIYKANEIGKRIDTLEDQKAKYDALWDKEEKIGEAESQIRGNISTLTSKLGEASYKLSLLRGKSGQGADAAKQGADATNMSEEELAREVDRLNASIKSEAENMHSIKLAREDLINKLDEMYHVLDAITSGDDTEKYKYKQKEEIDKLLKEESALYDKFSEQEKRDFLRRVGYSDQEIDEELGKGGAEFDRQELEKAVEMINKLPAIMGTTVTGTAVEVDTDEAASLFGQVISEGGTQEEVAAQEPIAEEESGMPRIIAESTSSGKVNKPTTVAATQYTRKVKDEIMDLAKFDAQIVGITVETEEVGHEGYIYDQLKNHDSATIIIKQGDQERVISGRDAVNLLIQRGEFYYLAGVGLVAKDRRQAAAKDELAEEYKKGFKKEMTAQIEMGESCDEVIKHFDQQCGDMHGQAVKSYCEKYNYSGCALDVAGCFSPYFPRQVFAGGACSDPKIMNCLKGPYGGFVGCVGGCNGQAAASGAAGLGDCLKACGEAIKGQIEGCYGIEKK